MIHSLASLNGQRIHLVEREQFLKLQEDTGNSGSHWARSPSLSGSLAKFNCQIKVKDTLRKKKICLQGTHK